MTTIAPAANIHPDTLARFTATIDEFLARPGVIDLSGSTLDEGVVARGNVLVVTARYGMPTIVERARVTYDARSEMFVVLAPRERRARVAAFANDRIYLQIV